MRDLVYNIICFIISIIICFIISIIIPFTISITILFTTNFTIPFTTHLTPNTRHARTRLREKQIVHNDLLLVSHRRVIVRRRHVILQPRRSLLLVQSIRVLVHAPPLAQTRQQPLRPQHPHASSPAARGPQLVAVAAAAQQVRRHVLAERAEVTGADGVDGALQLLARRSRVGGEPRDADDAAPQRRNEGTGEEEDEEATSARGGRATPARDSPTRERCSSDCRCTCRATCWSEWPPRSPAASA